MMKSINFNAFGIYTSIDCTEPEQQDVRRQIADAIYQGASGIEAHDIAFRIYRSEGPIDLSEGDEQLLTGFFRDQTKVWLYESFLQNLTPSKQSDDGRN